MVEVKEILKKFFACFLGLTPLLGTIYIIGRIRREKKFEETGWIDAYPSLKEGFIPFLKILFPILVILFLLFREIGFGIDPLLLILYPELFYPILVKILILKGFIEDFIKSSFFITAIEGRSPFDLPKVLLDIRKILTILFVSIISSLSFVYLREFSIFLNWKFLLSITYMFYFIR